MTSDSKSRVGLAALIADRLTRLERLIEPATRGGRCYVSAIAIAIAPLFASYATSTSWHQLLTAVLLAALCLPLAWRDSWRRGIATIGLAFFAHCALAIFLTARDPAGASALFPGGEEYWQKQWTWITTGKDPEYDWANWVPHHCVLFLGTTAYSFTSLGTLTFFHGFYEVDLMNYYNGRLLMASRDGTRALLLGWHLWSVLRGLGYTVISFETISIAVQFFARRRLAERRIHAARLILGASFLVADGIVKAVLLESVRRQLLENLLVP